MKTTDSFRPGGPARLAVPTTLSDMPTVPTKVDLDRTLPMEPVVLAQLCAQTQVSERRRKLPQGLEYSVHMQTESERPAPAPVSPPVIGGRAGVAEQSARQVALQTQRRQTLLLILGPCVGMSLGMSVAWQLDLVKPRSAVPPAVTTVAPRGSGSRPGVADANPVLHNVWRPSSTALKPTTLGAGATPSAPLPSGLAAMPSSGLAAPLPSGLVAMPSNGLAAMPSSGLAAMPPNGLRATPSNGLAATPSSGLLAMPPSGLLALSSVTPAAVASTTPAAGPVSGSGLASADSAAAPILEFAVPETLVRGSRPGAAHGPTVLERKPPVLRAGSASRPTAPAATATPGDEREALLPPAEPPAAEPPRSETTTLPPAKTTPPAVAKPSPPAEELDHGRAPRFLPGNKQPKLPLMVRQMYRHESVVGTYRLCVQPSGVVASVTAVAGIPFDDEIRRVLQTWRAAPRTTPACTDQELHFEVDE